MQINFSCDHSHWREETIVGAMGLSGQQRTSPQFSYRTVQPK
jgi:hypothetical protein